MAILYLEMDEIFCELKKISGDAQMNQITLLIHAGICEGMDLIFFQLLAVTTATLMIMMGAQVHVL